MHFPYSEAADDFARGDAGADDAGGPASPHFAAVGVQADDHGGPDDGEGVVDGGADGPEEDEDEPIAVFAEVEGEHWPGIDLASSYEKI